MSKAPSRDVEHSQRAGLPTPEAEEPSSSFVNTDPRRNHSGSGQIHTNTGGRDFTNPDEMRAVVGDLEERLAQMEALIQGLHLRTPTDNPPASSSASGVSLPPAPLERQPFLHPDLRPASEPTPAPLRSLPPSRITERIDPLSDGVAPTYRQWRTSIRDRLLVNADHYQTPLARKALIWGTTTSLARDYLEPRYASESPTIAFRDYQEMIDLLESYFLTGFEEEDARTDFMRMQMGVEESFSEFRGRFSSMAVLGGVPRPEWFYYLWEKILPELRDMAAPLKRRWNRNFDEMVADLGALDREHRRYGPDPEED